MDVSVSFIDRKAGNVSPATRASESWFCASSCTGGVDTLGLANPNSAINCFIYSGVASYLVINSGVFFVIIFID